MEVWESQYREGRWDHLFDAQPNTAHVAALVATIVGDSAKPFRVVDTGCGSGGLARLLQPLMKQLEYIGIDFSQTAIDQAALRLSAARWICSPLENAPS
jgi:trans-aconitate methyltransferase